MIIDTTPPQPGEHIPLRGQHSLLPDEPVGTEARAALRNWWLLNRGPEAPPKVESVRKLDLQCDVGRDREFWQMVRAAATEELGSLWARRYEWQQATEFGGADDAIADEVNLMLARLCGPEPTPAKESTMPAAVARKTKTPKPAKTTPTKPAAVDTSTTAKPELAGELRMIDIDLLHPSPYQTRRAPDPKWIDELATSMINNRQLTPCLVRPLPAVDGFELIAGHTRTTAARKINWPQIECRVVECDDATARRLVLVENAKRKDLDVIEEAQALKGLADAYADEGKSQRQLAADIGVSQSEISNSVRLLSLPGAWQERLITGEITKTQARDLLPWADVPAFWPALEAVRSDDDSLLFEETLWNALQDVSRPLAGSFYDEAKPGWVVVSFEPTVDERKRLDCRKVNGIDRAFNITLWESLQFAGEGKAAKKSARQAEATEGKVAAGKLDPKKAAEQFNKRLYRWKVGWLQQRIATALESRDAADTLVLLLVWFTMDGHSAAHERRTSLLRRCHVKVRDAWSRKATVAVVAALAGHTGPERTDLLLRTLQEWVLHPADTASTDMPPELVEWLALHLGIDIVRQWSLDRSYLDLLTTDRLQRLAAEWHLAGVHGVQRAALIDQMLERGKEKPCPKAVQEIKAVSLT